MNAIPAPILSSHDNNAAREAIMHSRRSVSYPTLDSTGFYIGLRDFSNNIFLPTQYRWDETNYRPGYTNWGSPPSRWSAGPEMCAAILPYYNYQWNDITCESGQVRNVGIICAREAQ